MMHACICTRCTAHPPPAARSRLFSFALAPAAARPWRGRGADPPRIRRACGTARSGIRRARRSRLRATGRGRARSSCAAARAPPRLWPGAPTRPWAACSGQRCCESHSPRRPLLVGARTRRRFRRRFGLSLCGRRHLRTAWPPRRCAPGLLRLRADNWGQARRLLGRCRRPRSSWRPLRGSRSRAGAPPKGSSCKPVGMGGAGGHPVRGKPPCLPVRSSRKRTSISARVFASLASNTPRCASACGAKATACLHILPLRSRTRRAHRRTCRSAPLLHRRGGRRRRRPARPRGAAWPMRRALRSTALRRPLGRVRARAT